MSWKAAVFCLLLLFRALAAEAAVVQNSDPVSGKYIVVLRDDAARGGEDSADAGPSVAEIAAGLTSLHGGTVTHIYEYALKGFAFEGTEDQAQAISTEPEVDYVEQDGNYRPTATQADPPWGLDRIDQRSRPLSRTYTYRATGAGVKAYIIDSGIRSTHVEFEGRVERGYRSFLDVGPEDCTGHGTAMASIVGGRTVGVAKQVRLVPVKVYGCLDVTLTSSLIAGIDWVTHDHQPGEPAVALLASSGGASSALDNAVRNSIRDGVTYVVPAGHNGCDQACFYSPARIPEALTVAATDINDRQFSFSDGGSCVDLYAPGQARAACSLTDSCYWDISGNSVAAAHAAGVVALYLEHYPSASPATVHSAIVGNATISVISGTCPMGTPNRMLYTNY